jgi:small nuclear ribonucleoprotein F
MGKYLLVKYSGNAKFNSGGVSAHNQMEGHKDRPKMENPKQFLARLQDKRVLVVLKWGPEYEGRLKSTDNYFNVLLSECVERNGEEDSKVGEVSIRCNNIKMIAEMEI